MHKTLSHVLAAAVMAVGSLVIAGVPAAPASAATEPDPLLNQAVFDDPIGTVPQQNAIFIQLGRLIDRVPGGEEIQMSMFDFNLPAITDTPDTPDLVGRLINAYARGVKLKIILDQKSALPAPAPYGRLLALLGNDDTADSYIVHCADQFPGSNRGCIGTREIDYSTGPVYAYNHNKFLTFSKIVMNDGTAFTDVVYQASSNLTVWDTNEAYNNAVTFTDPGVYGAYRTYFADLRRYRHSAAGNNNYYTVTPTGTTFKAHFFPRHEAAGQPVSDPSTDTIVENLKYVSCSYTDGGTRHQTDIRIVMWSFNRPDIAKQLKVLHDAGCWVDVVITDASSSVLSALGTGIQLTRCNFNVGPGLDIRAHSKYMLIDGQFGDDIVPRVFMGSHNYAVSSLRQADETLLRIMGRDWHDQYLHNFWHVRDTCTAHGGRIQ